MNLEPQWTLPPTPPNPLGVGYFDVEAGALVRRHLRHLLTSEETPDMTWFETKGWLSSTFHVQAEAQHAKDIYERIANLERVMDE